MSSVNAQALYVPLLCIFAVRAWSWTPPRNVIVLETKEAEKLRGEHRIVVLWPLEKLCLETVVTAAVLFSWRRWTCSCTHCCLCHPASTNSWSLPSTGEHGLENKLMPCPAFSLKAAGWGIHLLPAQARLRWVNDAVFPRWQGKRAPLSVCALSYPCAPSPGVLVLPGSAPLVCRGEASFFQLSSPLQAPSLPVLVAHSLICGVMGKDTGSSFVTNSHVLHENYPHNCLCATASWHSPASAYINARTACSKVQHPFLHHISAFPQSAGMTSCDCKGTVCKSEHL